MIRDGFWTDVVVLSDGRFAQITADEKKLRVFAGDDLAFEVPLAEEFLFLRASVYQGSVLAVGQGRESGKATVMAGGALYDFGPTFGVQPVAIDDQFVFVVRSGETWDRIRIADGLSELFPHPMPGSSQGILDVKDHAPIWTDPNRTAVIGGHTFTYPNYAGDLVVGQVDPPGIGGFEPTNGYFDVLAGDAWEPHVKQSGQSYAIVARTPAGAAYHIYNRQRSLEERVTILEQDVALIKERIGI